MKSKLILIWMIVGCFFANAQDKIPSSISDNIANLKQSGVTFETVNLFNSVENTELKQSLQPELKAHTLVSLSNSGLEKILNKENRFYNISIPLPDRSIAQLNLLESSKLLGDYTVRTSSGSAYTSIKDDVVVLRGEVDYNGVKGIAALTISSTEISGTLSLPHLGNFSIGKLKDQTTHVVYKDDDLVAENDFKCSVVEKTQNQRKKRKNTNHNHNTSRAEESQCVSVYIEAGFELFTNRGSVQASEVYIITLFNQVAVLYQNENIAISISDLLIWDTEDPYTDGDEDGDTTDSDSSDILDDFEDELDDNYIGNIAHLVDMDPGGHGGRAARDQLCDKDDAHAYSDVSPVIGTVPNYSWSVNVFSHEMGHTFGSYHTHDCEWGPNGNEQIDDCGSEFGDDEQGCYDDNNPIIPLVGGTIMSYCHLISAGAPGINFSLGFGQQPGDLLREKVADADCLGTCFPCDVTDNADFEIQFYCDSGSLSVQATSLDLDPENHWWGLYETDTQGEVGDANIVGGPLNVQDGISAQWTGLDENKWYFIKHGIWNSYCYNWTERRIPVEISSFHFEDKNGVEQTEFCFGDDVYLDASETFSTNGYLLYLAIKDMDGNYSLIGETNWIVGNLNIPINLSEIIFNDSSGNQIMFEAGTTYGVALPMCSTALLQDFTYVDPDSSIEYHFEDENGEKTNEFCLGEDVYINASDTMDADGYFMSLWKKNGDGTYSWIVGIDWQVDDLSNPINITKQFENLPNPVVFHPRTYAIKFSIIDPVCGQVWLQQDFTYKNCCELDPPDNLQFSANTLSWNPVVDADSYLVESSQTFPWPMDCSCPNPISIIPVTTQGTSVTFSISSNSCTMVQVTAVCADGTKSNPSEPLCVQFGHGVYNNTTVSVSPNPNNGKMHIKVETPKGNQNVALKIYDSKGILLKSINGLRTDKELLDYHLDLSNQLGRGICFFVFNIGDETIVQQVILE